MYLIISLKVEPRDLSDRSDDLDSLLIDYADLLQLSLEFWPIIGHTFESDCNLKEAVEEYLVKYRSRRIPNYSYLQSMVRIVTDLIYKFHEDLHSQLGPLLNDLGENAKVSLSRFLHKDALVRLELVKDET